MIFKTENFKSSNPLEKHGFSQFFQAQLSFLKQSEDYIDPAYIPARITAVHKELYEIFSEKGSGKAILKKSVYSPEIMKKDVFHEPFPTVGDFVLIRHNNSGNSQIFKTFMRKTFFSRRDPSPGRGEQAVSANFDYVFILQSLNDDFNVTRLERYLTLAWQSEALPVIILTKADLIADQAPLNDEPRNNAYRDYIRQVQATAPGVGVFAVSAHTKTGLNYLSDYLSEGKTAVLLGSSGVGKSSLVNALSNQELMKVKEIREGDSKGRHTTTHRQLIFLPKGAMLIDTPGMRELGMWDSSAGLSESFNDVEDFAAACKFSDCSHQSEPGCAVKAAIERGELPQNRLSSYFKLKREAKFSENKSVFAKQKREWQKSIAKNNRQKNNR